MTRGATRLSETEILSGGASIAAARRHIARRLREHGIESPELDARLLIGHALNLDHAVLMAQESRALADDEAVRIAALASRRLAREPVARILGRKEFWGLELCVTAATLVPRPETETVVETVLAAIDAAGARHRPLRIADLGTGSGALLLALLSELPHATGIGTDISAAALTVARENARRLGLAARAAFVLCDYAAALSGPFDIVVSNPPYVARAEIETLAPDVRDYDPRLALDGGADGLAAYRTIAIDARQILAPDSLLVLEVGAGQAAAVSAILHDGEIEAGNPALDLSGHARAIAGRLRAPGKVLAEGKIALGLCGKSD
ncbi:MAG TPA: peptide chain release factor N(5)-glutamine methyltransferase [Xanthobacteraceae bacterium]|nr:peptide chain release factor N(5)-glutamine methyltransferase [Xanthobacteraceae bacterium]